MNVAVGTGGPRHQVQDGRTRFAFLAAKPRWIGRDRSPPHVVPPFIVQGAFDNAARVALARRWQQARAGRPDARVRRPFDRPFVGQQRPRDGCQDAAAVRRAQAITAAATVRQPRQCLEAYREPLMASPCQAVGDKADAAGVVLAEHFNLAGIAHHPGELSSISNQKKNRTSTYDAYRIQM